MKLQPTLIFTAFLCIASVAGLSGGNEDEQLGRLINAPPTTIQPDDYPFMVSIEIGGNHTCGGFIYNEEWVITAASCVANKSVSDVKVVVGQLSLLIEDEYEKKYSAFSVIIEPSYNSATKANNVAMIQLAEKILLSSAGVNCIYYDEVDTTTSTGTILGWGTTFESGTVASVQLKRGPVNGFKSNCSGVSGFDRNFMICAGGGPSDAIPCTLDEGGPLVQATTSFGNIVVGIYSHSGCKLGQPAVYTRLAPYYAWFAKYGQLQPIDTCHTSPLPPPSDEPGDYE